MSVKFAPPSVDTNRNNLSVDGFFPTPTSFVASLVAESTRCHAYELPGEVMSFQLVPPLVLSWRVNGAVLKLADVAMRTRLPLADMASAVKTVFLSGVYVVWVVYAPMPPAELK
jgi:hypothetical protein